MECIITWFRINGSFYLSYIFRVQSLFSWTPEDMTNPLSSSFSFKAIIENPKMKVGTCIFLLMYRGMYKAKVLLEFISI